MRSHKYLRGAGFGLVALLLVSCEDGATFGGDSFRAQYTVARNALEEGNYPRANRAYERLLPKSGAMETRVRLEYAHSQLRAGNFAAAATQARLVANSPDPAAHPAGLAVLGTAEHELGLALIRKGDTAGGVKLLRQAETSLSKVLKKNQELDPLGALSDRRASIRARLKAL